MPLSQDAEDAVEAATASSARVADRARSISAAIQNRPARARTNPFMKVEDAFEEEDSMVTSIEKVIEQSQTSINVEK